MSLFLVFGAVLGFILGIRSERERIARWFEREEWDDYEIVSYAIRHGRHCGCNQGYPCKEHRKGPK